MIRFSILVPVYNVEKYIKECLDSIVNQTFGDYELILIDDGSTDGSGKICDEYAAKYANIKTVHQSNKGLLFSRRLAFSLASGEYCVVVDSDDFIANNMLELLNNCINQYSPDMIIIGAHKYFEGKTYLHKKPICQGNRLFNQNDKAELYEKLLSRELSNTLWTKICKRSILDSDDDYSNYYDVSMGEDLLQTLPLITAANTVYYLNEKLYYYRTNPASLTQKFNPLCINSLDKVNKKLDEYLPIWKLEFGEKLAGFRYMIDVYDIFCSAVKAHNKKSVREMTDFFENSQYFQEKYKSADLSKLSARQRGVVSSLFQKNKIKLFAMRKLIELQCLIKYLLRKG